MKRLTYWNCKEKGSALPVAINELGDTVGLEDICAKLADYEDIGLEPSEFEAMKTAMIGKSISEIKEFDGVSIDHLRELVKAEKEGKIIVFPCNVGQSVYFYQKYFREICPATIVSIEVNGHTPTCPLWIRIEYTSTVIGKHEYLFRSDIELGKTIFLTREEVEVALGGDQN